MKRTGEKKKWNIAAGLKTRSFRIGGYSIAITLVVLAIAIAVNVLAGALPATWTQFDTTSLQLLSISEQTEKIVRSLDTQVNVYWIVQSGQEDTTLEGLLSRYTALNSNVKLTKKDPDVYPTFAQQYTSHTITNNSLVIESGQRYCYIGNDEIYVYDTSNYYYTGSYDVSFDGESAITSAIAYVTNEDLPRIYILSGHGEMTLPDSFREAIGTENMETAELSLLTMESVPEDADCILVCAPTSDLAEEEKEMLSAYLQGGGNLFLITAPLQEDVALTNLNALMEQYGVTTQKGIVVEGSQNNYAFGTPHYLLPNLSSHAVTEPLLDAGYYVLLPIAGGLKVDSVPSGVTVSKLLTTSSSAFSKIAGYGLTTYEKEEGDIDGSFALAVAITDYNSDGKIVWVSSSALVAENCNSRVSGGNQDFFLNSLGWMCEQEESISIHAKSLEYDYLTMDSGTMSVLTVLVMIILPAGFLAMGILVWFRRKRR